MAEGNDPFGIDDDKQLNGATLDIQLVLFKVLKRWPFFLIFTLVGLLVVYAYHRYTTERYRLHADIQIPETKTNIDPGLLAEFAFDFSTNFLNELVILNSKQLTIETLENLEFGVQYFSKGRIKTVEEYKTLPFKVQKIEGAPQIFEREFRLTFHERNQYRLTLASDENHETSELYNPYGTVETDQYGLKLFWESSPNLNGREFYFVLRSEESLINEWNRRANATYLREFTSVARVSLETTVPRKGADYLNTLLDVYRGNELEKKNETAEKTIVYIDREMKALNDTLNAVASQLDQVRIDNKVLSFDDVGSNITKKINDLEVQKGLNQRAIDKLNENMAFLEDSTKFDQIVLPAVLLDVEDELNLYIQRLSAKHLERQDKRKSLAEFNEQIQDLNFEIESLRSAIQSTIRLKISELESLNTSLSRELRSYEGEFEKYPVTQRRVSDIQRIYDLYYGMFLYFRQKRAEAGIVKASNVANATVVDRATPNVAPHFPNRPINNALGAGIGFSIPLFFVLLQVVLNNKVENRKQIEALTNIPIMGVVGHNSKPGNLAVLDGPKSVVSETFRSLRANLAFFNQGKEIKKILITSNASGEGKSFCSINMASILAISGKRTVLVGLDLRKPKIYGDFGLSNDHGVSNYLAGFVEKEQIIQSTDFENLDVISAGPVPPNPSELLMTQKLTDLLNELAEEYDHVVIDTPPIGIVSDTFNLTRHADLCL